MPDPIDIQRDPDNPSTVILSRWPDEADVLARFLVAHARGTTLEPPGEPQGGPVTSAGTLTGGEPSEPENGSEGLGGGGPEDVVGFPCDDCPDHVPFKTQGALTGHRTKYHTD